MIAICGRSGHASRRCLRFDPAAIFGVVQKPVAASDGRGRGVARGGRDRGLFLPVSPVVRAAEDVAAGVKEEFKQSEGDPHVKGGSGSCGTRG